MTRTNALQILGLNDDADSEMCQDAYEDKVFELVNFFMRRAFIPKLAMAKIKRLEMLTLAANALEIDQMEAINHPSSTLPFVSANSLDSLISSYHAEEALIKQRLASALSAPIAISVYSQWIAAFETYADRYIRLYEMAAFYQPADPFVKISEDSDPTALVAECSTDTALKPMLHKAYSRYIKIKQPVEKT